MASIKVEEADCAYCEIKADQSDNEHTQACEGTSYSPMISHESLHRPEQKFCPDQPHVTQNPPLVMKTESDVRALSLSGQISEHNYVQDLDLDESCVIVIKPEPNLLDRTQNGCHATFEMPGITCQTPNQAEALLNRQSNGETNKMRYGQNSNGKQSTEGCHMQLTYVAPPINRESGLKACTSHTCQMCHAVFSYKSQLTRHRRTHMKERPQVCPPCNIGFIGFSGHLKTHLRTHTGERPFACSTCDKRFSRSETLRRHIKSHTRKRPSPCSTYVPSGSASAQEPVSCIISQSDDHIEILPKDEHSSSVKDSSMITDELHSSLETESGLVQRQRPVIHRTWLDDPRESELTSNKQIKSNFQPLQGDDQVPHNDVDSSSETEISQNTDVPRSSLKLGTRERSWVVDHQCKLNEKHKIVNPAIDSDVEEEEEEESGLYVAKIIKSNKTKAGKLKKSTRVWNRFHYCPYCEFRGSNIAKHLRKSHSDEEAIVTIKECEEQKNGASSSRKSIIEKIVKLKLGLIRNEGDDKHNMNTFRSKKGEIVVARRSATKLSLDNIGPCPFCKQWSDTKELKRHARMSCSYKLLRRLEKIIDESNIRENVPGNQENLSETVTDDSHIVSQIDDHTKILPTDCDSPTDKESSMLHSSLDTGTRERKLIVKHQCKCRKIHKTSNPTIEGNVEAEEEEDQLEIYVTQIIKSNKTKGGKLKKSTRVWNRFHYCPYCEFHGSNIAKHLRKSHSDEEAIVAIKGFEEQKDCASSSRKSMIEKIVKLKLGLLRNEGDDKHNMNTFRSKKGEIVVARRSAATKLSLDHIGPCRFCKQWMDENELDRHAKERCSYRLLRKLEKNISSRENRPKNRENMSETLTDTNTTMSQSRLLKDSHIKIEETSEKQIQQKQQKEWPLQIVNGSFAAIKTNRGGTRGSLPLPSVQGVKKETCSDVKEGTSVWTPERNKEMQRLFQRFISVPGKIIRDEIKNTSLILSPIDDDKLKNKINSLCQKKRRALKSK